MQNCSEAAFENPNGKVQISFCKALQSKNGFPTSFVTKFWNLKYFLQLSYDGAPKMYHQYLLNSCHKYSKSFKRNVDIETENCLLQLPVSSSYGRERYSSFFPEEKPYGEFGYIVEGKTVLKNFLLISFGDGEKELPWWQAFVISRD